MMRHGLEAASAGLKLVVTVAIGLAAAGAPAQEAPAAGRTLSPPAVLPTIEQFLEIRGQYGATIAPDGSAVAYLDRTTGVPAAWIVPAGGGWPEQLTFFAERVRSVSWSPWRREQIIVESDVGGNERSQLFLFDPAGGRPRRLTPDDETTYGLGGFAPDGHTVAIRANSRDRAAFDIHLLDLVTGQSRPVLELGGINMPGRFSPDGRTLIVSRSLGPDQTQLVLVDVATGEPRPLTAESPAARYAYAHWSADGRSLLLLTDRGRDTMTLARLDLTTRELHYLRQDRVEAERLAVSADGRRVALVLNVDGLSELVLLDLMSGEVPELEPVPLLPVGVILGLDWTPDGGRLTITMAESRSPGTVYIWDRVRRTLTAVTRPALAGVKPELLVDPSVVRYPAFDGRTISGLLYRPLLPPGSPPPPCLAVAHGGPTGQARPSFSAISQFLVTRGCAVFMPNVRGSSGYGREFRRLDDRERREDSVADLEQGVVWLAREGMIDSTRVAVYGSSYGGYMVLAALTLYPDRFAAGVDQVGIANFVSFLERTAPYRRTHREGEYGSLDTDRELLTRLSPLNRVDRIRAPLLVIHGANDPRVPVGEAEQIVAALEARGLAVEFLRFDDEGHGISRHENRIYAYGRMVRFLATHLGLAPEPEPLPPPSESERRRRSDGGEEE